MPRYKLKSHWAPILEHLEDLGSDKKILDDASAQHKIETAKAIEEARDIGIPVSYIAKAYGVFNQQIYRIEEQTKKHNENTKY